MLHLPCREAQASRVDPRHASSTRGERTSTVLVTGAASGIGRAIGRHLARTGTALTLLDLDGDGLITVAHEAREAGAPEVVAIAADVADVDQVADAFATAHRILGDFDGLVCAAGIIEPAGLADTTAESWERHFAVNTTGVLHCLQSGRARLRDGSAVVVVSSNAARVPRIGMLAYSASKAATSALTRAAGLELASRGIRCNVVEPGSTDTPMQRALWPDTVTGTETALRGDAAVFRTGIPLGRLATPDDVAGVACFLLSDAARHVTLQQIYVDGGASL